MRIVFVSGWYPYPADNGARIRIFNLVKELARRHTIHFVSFYDDYSAPSRSRILPLSELCASVQIVKRPAYHRSLVPVIMSLISQKPPYIAQRYNPDMSDVVKKCIYENKPDLIALSEIQNLPVLEDLSFRIPVLLEQFEAGTIWEREDTFRGLRRITHSITRHTWEKFILSQIDKLQGITVPSIEEGKIVQRLLASRNHTNIPVALISNGICGDFCNYPIVKKEDDILIYQGSLEFSANHDAMEYFLTEIMPLIKKDEPEVLLRITGAYDGADVSMFNHENVDLTGYLDDMVHAVSAAAVCVIPLRFGSGTRIKALEAMALGTPVVSTAKGVEGLDVEDEVHVLIADNSELFAQKVIRLLSDIELRHRLITNARQLVLEQYTWSQIGRQLSDFCETVVLNQMWNRD